MPQRKGDWEKLSKYTQKRYILKISRKYGVNISTEEVRSLYEGGFSIYRKTDEEKREETRDHQFQLGNRLAMYDEQGRKIRGFKTDQLQDGNGLTRTLNLEDFEDEDAAAVAVFNMLSECLDEFRANYNEGYRKFQVILKKPGGSKGRQFLFQTLAVNFEIQDVFNVDSRFAIAEEIAIMIWEEEGEIAGFNFLV